MAVSTQNPMPSDVHARGSVRAKLMRVVLLTTALALAVSGISMLLHELYVYRTAWTTDISTEAAIAAWGEYFIPLILAGPKTTPATVGVVNFVGYDAINWGAMAAAALMLVVPVFFLTLAAQRGLLRGLTAGAVKG